MTTVPPPSAPTLAGPTSALAREEIVVQAGGFRHVALLYHPKKPESLPLAERMRDFLTAHGRTVWTGSAWDEPEVLANIEGVDLLITLGGDGTILRAARLAATGRAETIPILGVKLGRVSFLAEVSPDDWQTPLGQLMAGECWLEERMLLDVAVAREGRPAVNHSYLALNDVVVSRGGMARLVTVGAFVDQHYLTTYRADGVIVSTPTGCTGYALAAGGPILPPELKNILLIPICPHLSLDRPVVLAQGATVTLEAHADYAPILTVDGQFEIALAEGDRVEVRASPRVSQFVHVQDRAYFYRTLMDRLRWRG